VQTYILQINLFSHQYKISFQAPVRNALITSSRHWPSICWKVKMKNTTFVQIHF